MKIGLLVFADNEYRKKFQIGFESLKKYSKLHKIDFLPKSESIGLHPFYARHYEVLSILKNYEYLICSDVDMAVVNYGEDIRGFIKKNTDKNAIFFWRISNAEAMAGFYIIKNCDWSERFLSKWIACEGEIYSDNAALMLLILMEYFPKEREELFEFFINNMEFENYYYKFLPFLKSKLEGREELSGTIKLVSPFLGPFRFIEFDPKPDKYSSYNNILWRRLIGNEIFVHTKNPENFGLDTNSDGQVKSEWILSREKIGKNLKAIFAEYPINCDSDNKWKNNTNRIIESLEAL